jgi:hypothetical protein
VEGNGGSLKDGAEAFVLFLRGAQLVLRSSVLTVLDLGEVNVTLGKLRSLGRYCLGKVKLLMASGAAEVPPVSFSCPMPLQRTHPPSLLFPFYFVFAGMGATSTASGHLEAYLFLSGKRGGKNHFGIILIS